MKLLAGVQDLIVRVGLAPGRSVTGPWILRFILVNLAGLLLWVGLLWGLARTSDWILPYWR